jgi:transposase
VVAPSLIPERATGSRRIGGMQSVWRGCIDRASCRRYGLLIPGTKRSATWCVPVSTRCLRCAGRASGSTGSCYGCHYGRPALTKLHRRWLADLKFEQAARHLVLEDYLQTVEAAEVRRDRLTAQIEGCCRTRRRLLWWHRCKPCAARATSIAELGDLSRFANPRQLTAYCIS